MVTVTVPLRVFSDASGAPAVIAHDGYAFAFDMLGRVTVSCIRPLFGTRISCERAKDLCEREYAKLIAERVDAEWLARNAAMYADVA